MTDNPKSNFKLPKNLVHYFLVPTEKMDDKHFCDALIYLCGHHNEKGAFGFIINQPLSLSVGAILEEMDICASQEMMNMAAIKGGVMYAEVGYVLHTGLPTFASSLAIGENVCLSTSKDVLKSISLNKMQHFLLCMGMTRWSKGQLEKEILDGKWRICRADLMILFKTELSKRLALMQDRLGILPKLDVVIGRA